MVDWAWLVDIVVESYTQYVNREDNEYPYYKTSWKKFIQPFPSSLCKANLIEHQFTICYKSEFTIYVCIDTELDAIQITAGDLLETNTFTSPPKTNREFEE